MKDRSFTATTVLGRGLDVWVRSLPVLAAMAMVVIAPIYVVWHLLPSGPFGPFWGILFIGTLFGQFLVNGLSARAVFDGLDGIPVALGQTARSALGQLPSLAITCLVLAVLAGAPLLVAGFVFDGTATQPSNSRVALSLLAAMLTLGLCMPFYLMLCLAPYACVMERKSLFSSIQRAQKVSKGERTTLLTLHMLTILVQCGMIGVVILPLRAAEDASRSLAEPSTFIALLLAMLLTSTAAAAVGAAAYHDQRLKEEGFGLGALRRIFE